MCIRDRAYTESGTVINSGEWTGMDSAVLKKEAPEIIEKRGIGKKTTNYKLRDWVFSRQRYWGEPIPVSYTHLEDMVTNSDISKYKDFKVAGELLYT